MIRTLALISVAGFVLATVCLIVAVSLAGPDILAQGAWGWTNHSWDGRHGWNWTSHDDRDGDSQASRDLAWSGGETLAVDLPADLTFNQADGPPKLTVRGSPRLINHVIVDGGHLRWDGPGFRDGEISVELTAPKVTRFDLGGSGKLDIHGYRQDRLTLNVNGSGDVTADGTSKAVELTLDGSGNADLSSLTIDDARVKIEGSGGAKLGPRDTANLEIAGSGDVTLTNRPHHEESTVTGSGHVSQGADSDDSDSAD